MLTLNELIKMRLLVVVPESTGDQATLAERFLIPPFSVLDARQGYWQKRKRMWLELGIQSELGRGETPSTSARVGLEDEATYRPIGGRKSDAKALHDHDCGASHGHGIPQMGKGKNGLLGFSEQARSHYKANATPEGSLPEATTLKNDKTQRGDGRGRPLATTFGSGGPGDLASGFLQSESGARNLYGAYDREDDVSSRITAAQPQSGTSIFDPVLCEIAYRWFCPPGGAVLDPFAGGSVRGIVAAKLGRSYAGVDLRPEQAEANYAQAEMICHDCDSSLSWVVGDSLNIDKLLPGEYDLVFSCPPYADLERYSDDPRDLSTMDYDRFLDAYRTIIAQSCAMLKNNRFACFVVGDVRNRATGNYRGFVGDTIEAFRAAGLELYNDAVLITAVGSLPIRVGRQFVGYRKLGKTHQNLLVFIKGDAGLATGACGEIDTDDLDMPERTNGLAICAGDVDGLQTAKHIASGVISTRDVLLIDSPVVDAALLCDIVRGEAWSTNKPIPRVWVGTPNEWKKVEVSECLTYIVGGNAYLSKSVFPDAKTPVNKTPTPEAVW